MRGKEDQMMDTDQRGAFSLAEIFSQPDVWNETLEEFTNLSAGNLPDIHAYDQLVFMGCGSTYFLSTWAARLFMEKERISAQALPASEIWLSPKTWFNRKKKKTLLVAISRSGTTTETILAVKEFQTVFDGDVLVITCYPESELAQMGKWQLFTPAGQEQSVAQTRSFTCMMLATLFLLHQRVPGNLERGLYGQARTLLHEHRELARRLGSDENLDRFFFLGSGAKFGLASEVMLKMKEMSLSYSEAYHTLEFRHGPMSMVNEQTLVIGLLSDRAKQHEIAVLRDMKGLGAKTLGVSASTIDQGEALDYLVSFESSLDGSWHSLLYLPFLQLLAYERSIARGLNPDQPENLESVVVLENERG
jgi:glutamine---fructose-6-phosphate transaminase (isomerizing)